MPDPAETTGTAHEPGSVTATPESSSSPESAPERTSWLESLPDDAQDYVKQLRTEAAKYRSERNGLRDEVGSLRQRIDAHDRGRVESIASERLHDARDLLDRLRDLDEVRGVDGLISEDAVKARIKTLLDERPHLGKPTPGQRAREWAGARGTRPESTPSFGEALKNRHHP